MSMLCLHNALRKQRNCFLGLVCSISLSAYVTCRVLNNKYLSKSIRKLSNIYKSIDLIIYNFLTLTLNFRNNLKLRKECTDRPYKSTYINIGCVFKSNKWSLFTLKVECFCLHGIYKKTVNVKLQNQTVWDNSEFHMQFI